MRWIKKKSEQNLHVPEIVWYFVVEHRSIIAIVCNKKIQSAIIIDAFQLYFKHCSNALINHTSINLKSA